ncbi:MAG: hypothetical protein EXR80_08860 [Methylococcales bacterium]|nr:hypothetical protein [Methylococcales bacterium]
MKIYGSFAKEITIALIIKFAFFGLVWWLFFAGQNIHVDEVSLNNRLLGNPVTPTNQPKGVL